MAAILQTTCTNQFWHGNCCILIQISLKVVPKVNFAKKATLVKIMVWRRLDAIIAYICVTRLRCVNDLCVGTTQTI